MIIELKQWSAITPIEDKDYVTISVGGGQTDIRKHPVSQMCEYKAHMSKNHQGIYRKKGAITIDAVAYLHNFEDKRMLFCGEYAAWNEYGDRVFVRGDELMLTTYLRDSFSNINNHNMPEVIADCGYMMDEAGFTGLRKALSGEENARMVKDQMAVVDHVRDHLKIQMENPHKEIIVVSGGPGTGKTIVGMHFIYDYADIFHHKGNADGAVFCLPRSRTVKAVIDYECKARDMVPFLNRNIIKNHNLVVVDEAHRITKLNSELDGVFCQGAKLLIMLQDDHQRIRPEEEGTFKRIKEYAIANGIEFTSFNLTIQKRCETLGNLLDGLESMFYGKGRYDGKSIRSVQVFDRLQIMDQWIMKLASCSRAKMIAPYCWKWDQKTDIRIWDRGKLFQKLWNPQKPQEQAVWVCEKNRANQAASIYTCQGLDFDHVAFIWWDDLVWDDQAKRWKANMDKSKDSAFVNGVKAARLSQEDVDDLFINTYYVMLSRARNQMGIWFRDEATRKHVAEFLGLEIFTDDESITGADQVCTRIHVPVQKTDMTGNRCNQAIPVIGNRYNKSFHKPECRYAPYKPEKRIEFQTVEEAKRAGYSPCKSCNPLQKPGFESGGDR